MISYVFLTNLIRLYTNIGLLGEMCHNKEEGDHSCYTLGEDAIGRRKMLTWSAKLVYLAGFLFQNPDTEAFQN